MKILKTLIAIITCIGIAYPAWSADLLRIHVEKCNFKITEIDRKEKMTTLKVEGFHKRTASCSRWLMCLYSQLAVQRGSKYVVMAYPSASSENVAIGFPATSTENVVETIDPIFSKNRLDTIETEKLALVCGMIKCQANSKK